MKLKTYFLLLLMLAASAIAFAQEADDELLDEADDERFAAVDEAGYDIPEGLSENVDSLLALYNAQQYLAADADCNFPDVNPQYSAEEIQARLGKLPTVIEMPYNSVVREFIDRYAGRMRRSVSVMLGAANFYMPLFEEALESYGLPLELKYLPIVESALNPKAVSRAGATGLWQFMLVTGQKYGLEVNSLVDERQDPIKASYAAAHYLSDLYAIFGDWNLAIAAYNCGPENVNKAIHRANGEKDYWLIYPYLPRETRGYLPAFIATNYIMNYYCEHNICPMRATLPVKTDTVVVSRDVHFEQIAHVLDIDIKAVEALNPQYRRSIINGGTKPSTLRLPATDIINFIDNEDAVYAYRASELLTKRAVTAVNTPPPAPARRGSATKRRRGSGARTTTVRKGDTLGAIAKRNGTTVKRLKQLNPSIKGTTIVAGKKLRVK